MRLVYDTNGKLVDAYFHLASAGRSGFNRSRIPGIGRRGATMSFSGPIFYSCDTPVAFLCQDERVLFVDGRTYSAPTGAHQRALEQAAKRRGYDTVRLKALPKLFELGCWLTDPAFPRKFCEINLKERNVGAWIAMLDELQESTLVRRLHDEGRLPVGLNGLVSVAPDSDLGQLIDAARAKAVTIALENQLTLLRTYGMAHFRTRAVQLARYKDAIRLLHDGAIGMKTDITAALARGDFVAIHSALGTFFISSLNGLSLTRNVAALFDALAEQGKHVRLVARHMKKLRIAVSKIHDEQARQATMDMLRQVEEIVAAMKNGHRADKRELSDGSPLVQRICDAFDAISDVFDDMRPYYGHFKRQWIQFIGGDAVHQIFGNELAWEAAEKIKPIAKARARLHHACEAFLLRVNENDEAVLSERLWDGRVWMETLREYITVFMHLRPLLLDLSKVSERLQRQIDAGELAPEKARRTYAEIYVALHGLARTFAEDQGLDYARGASLREMARCLEPEVMRYSLVLDRSEFAQIKKAIDWV